MIVREKALTVGDERFEVFGLATRDAGAHAGAHAGACGSFYCAPVVGGKPAPGERAPIRSDGATVEFDRPVECFERNRHSSDLERVAQQERVRIDRVAHQCRGEFGGRQGVGVACCRGFAYGRFHGVEGKVQVRVGREVGRRCHVGVQHRGGAALREFGEGLEARAHHRVAPDQEVGRSVSDARGEEVVGAFRDADVARHGTVLLGKARHVELRRPLALEVGCHAQDRPDGDDSGSADAGDEHVPGLVAGREFRKRQFGEGFFSDLDGISSRPSQAAAGDGDEARAVALHAREVLVARRLVDPALAAVLGFDGFHRDAVALHRAVAAALAHEFVDHDAPVRIGEFSAFAQPPRLGGARLVVDQRRHPGNVAQFRLDAVQVVPVVHADSARKGARGVLRGFIGEHLDASDPLGVQLAHDFGSGDLALDRFSFDGLSTGHRDGAVHEDLERDVHVGGHAGPDGQEARVEVGAVSHVLEDVRHFDERRLADPVRPFAAHVRGAVGAPAREPGGHAVTTDAPERDGALGHHGGCVVRAAGAERRHPCQGRGGCDGGRVRKRPQVTRVVPELALEPAEHEPCNEIRREFAFVGDEGRSGFVVLPDQARTIRLVVENARELLLDERSFLLDHQDVLEVPAERDGARRFEGPAECDLVDRNAEFRRPRLVDAELLERLAHVEVGLARGDDAQPAAGRVDHDPVESVGAHVGLGGGEFHLEELPLDFQQRIAAADVVVSFRERELRIDGSDAVRPHQDRGAAVDGVCDALEPHPATGVAGERPAVESQVDVVLDVGWIEDGNPAVDEGLLALVGDRGGLGAGIVSAECQHAAVARCPGVVRVLDRVGGTVDAGAFSVPDAEDTGVFRAFPGHRLLGAPDGGGGEVLVHARLEVHPVPFQELACLPQGQVIPAERRAAIAGNEARGRQSRGFVPLPLHEGQAHQGLHAGQVHASALAPVAVVQLVGGVEGCGGFGHARSRASIVGGVPAS